MTLNTCSALISFHGRLEDQVAKFYETLAGNERYAVGRETFLLFAKENKKHKEIVKRVYYEVITDGLEACYLNPVSEEHYSLNTNLTANTSYPSALRMAIEVEERSYLFCVDASEASKNFMADIPQALRTIAKRKAERREILKSLLDKASVQ